MYNLSWNTICSQNESFHTTLWNYAPKTKFRSRAIIEVAAKMAACQFNHGMVSFARSMQLLEIPAGSHSFALFESLDKTRIESAEVAAQKSQKTKRAEHRRKRKSRLEKQRIGEGASYEAGGFGGDSEEPQAKVAKLSSRKGRGKGRGRGRGTATEKGTATGRGRGRGRGQGLARGKGKATGTPYCFAG